MTFENYPEEDQPYVDTINCAWCEKERESKQGDGDNSFS